MKVLKLMFKNAFRHKLRTSLTIVGIAIAVIAFSLLRTVVTVYNAGVDASSADRLITRHAVSFIFPLPYSYKDKIQQIDGVELATPLNWFQGVYIDKDQFFARLAVDPETVFKVYPEFILSKEELDNFKKERNSCVIGIDIAKQYNLKIGDIMTIDGDIYPGRWDFVVRGIYKPKDKTIDGTQMFFQYDYLNERLEAESPMRANEIGWFAIKIKDPNRSAEISAKVDKLFKNSSAETKTETERAFQQGFLSAVSAIITALNYLSFIIIGIILLVLANTMIMAARERTREYAVMKTLGFSAKHLVGLIMGESLVISVLGGGLGLLLSFPVVDGFGQAIPKGMFPIFYIEPITIILAVTAALSIGVISSIFPLIKALSTKIVDGFRFVG
ncbi:MAG: FtsX-like permease family protein [Ignavibacteriaceae bacterium]|jgi:putative ABC transport system permease protein|nr:FtsX-like permease family protein [Ignavibacteriaceae bacterium]